jgi:phosphoglucomutase
LDYIKKYNSWLENPYYDEDTKKELLDIRGNGKEIEDRFYRDLEFGTGGLRGIIGAGTNRINRYTIRKASQGLSNYIKKLGAASPSIAIAYDSRRCSDEFAKESACVFAVNGIKSYIFESLRPTPELSFAVRHLNCDAGIVITASHNPKEYNGYKVYGKDGGQMPPDASNAVLKEVNLISDLTAIQVMDFSKAKAEGLDSYSGTEIDNAYIESLKSLKITEPEQKIKDKCGIVYTPLHGSGNIPVRRILKETGFNNVYCTGAGNARSRLSDRKIPEP